MRERSLKSVRGFFGVPFATKHQASLRGGHVKLAKLGDGHGRTELIAEAEVSKAKLRTWSAEADEEAGRPRFGPLP